MNIKQFITIGILSLPIGVGLESQIAKAQTQTVESFTNKSRLETLRNNDLIKRENFDLVTSFTITKNRVRYRITVDKSAVGRSKEIEKAIGDLDKNNVDNMMSYIYELAYNPFAVEELFNRSTKGTTNKSLDSVVHYIKKFIKENDVGGKIDINIILTAKRFNILPNNYSKDYLPIDITFSYTKNNTFNNLFHSIFKPIFNYDTSANAIYDIYDNLNTVLNESSSTIVYRCDFNSFDNYSDATEDQKECALADEFSKRNNDYSYSISTINSYYGSLPSEYLNYIRPIIIVPFKAQADPDGNPFSIEYGKYMTPQAINAITEVYAELPNDIRQKIIQNLGGERYKLLDDPREILFIYTRKFSYDCGISIEKIDGKIRLIIELAGDTQGARYLNNKEREVVREWFVAIAEEEIK
jgi:hypothetical protein